MIPDEPTQQDALRVIKELGDAIAATTERERECGGPREKLNKSQTLALAGAIAPTVREQHAAASERRVALVDAEGNVVGYTTLAEVKRQILARAKIEFSVMNGRPKKAFCEACGAVIQVKRVGAAPTQCRKCRRAVCVDCGVDRKQYGKLRCAACWAKARAAPTCRRGHSRPAGKACRECQKINNAKSHAKRVAARRDAAMKRTAEMSPVPGAPSCANCGIGLRTVEKPCYTRRRAGKPPMCKSCSQRRARGAL